MANLEIRLEDEGSEGRYVATLPGARSEAELGWIRPDPKLLAAVHTYTPEPLRGRGIALALVERLIADARAQGFRIIPSCPYVAAQFQRHPEWNDVLAER